MYQWRRYGTSVSIIICMHSESGFRKEFLGGREISNNFVCVCVEGEPRPHNLPVAARNSACMHNDFIIRFLLSCVSCERVYHISSPPPVLL